MLSIYFWFLTVFVTLLSLNYLLCMNNIISLIGSTIVLCLISWKITKWFTNYYSRKNPISSFRKAVLITGCDSGFGNILAQKLNVNGFVVYATVLDSDSDGAKYLMNKCLFPNNMHVIKMDVTNDDEVTKTYNYVCEHLKDKRIELWGLVNNAGICTYSHIEWSSLDLYHKMFNVNVFGVVRVTRTFLPLIRQSKGRIVNFGSISSKNAIPFCSHYSMSKSALLSFTDALRRELHIWDVKVSDIFAGPFNIGFANENNLIQEYDNAWNTTNHIVKRAHSHEYFELKRREMVNNLNQIKKLAKIDLVINAIIDALTNKTPQISYLVIESWKISIVMFLNELLPTECMDQILFTQYKY